MRADEIEQKIEGIKNTRDYLRSAENQDYVSRLEKTLERIKTDEAFQQTDQVQILRNAIKSVIVDCGRKLVNEDDPVLRHQIKADRRSYAWLLQFFCKDIDTELQSIEEKLDTYLER